MNHPITLIEPLNVTKLKLNKLEACFFKISTKGKSGPLKLHFEDRSSIRIFISFSFQYPSLNDSEELKLERVMNIN